MKEETFIARSQVPLPSRLVPQHHRPRGELQPAQGLQIDMLAIVPRTTSAHGPPALGCTMNSYSSINPKSANAIGSFTPPTRSPLPDSRLSCRTAVPNPRVLALHSSRPAPGCPTPRTSWPRRSFGRRVPSTQAKPSPAPTAETPTPSFRKSPGQTGGHQPCEVFCGVAVQLIVGRNVAR